MALQRFLWYTCPMLSHLPPTHAAHVAPETAVDATTPFPASVLVTLHFDGSCSPNPGPMGIGYTLSIQAAPEGKSRVIARVGALIGRGTNNEAEYQSLISGLRHALRLGFFQIEVLSDSLLVVNQMTGQWKAKDSRLKRLLAEASTLASLFTEFSIRHIYREENAGADELSRVNLFEEIQLPSVPTRPGHGFQPMLFAWQAAAIRVWLLSHKARAGLLSRIFGVEENVIEQIRVAKSYRAADFRSYGWFIQHLVYPAGTVVEPNDYGGLFTYTPSGDPSKSPD